MSKTRSKAAALACALRAFEASDREALLDLWVAAWRETMPTIPFEERREWFRGHLAQLERRGFVLRCATAARDGRILGFIVLSPEIRHLEQIVVDLRDWGKGVGGALLGEAKRLSPRGLWLDVNEGNPRAIAFYEKHGFRRLRAGRNPGSGLPTFRYAWGEAEPRET